jgi:cyanate lyase
LVVLGSHGHSGHTGRGEEELVNRSDCTDAILEAKRQKGLSLQELADKIGRHVVWTTSAIMGQATMDLSEAETLAQALDLGSDVVEALQEIPMKGSLPEAVPVDPLIYRLHEITQVYGTTIKAVIHEMFGDGIMSAIDFEMDIQRISDPKGDRVQLTYNGKFLPYRKW